MAVDPKAIRSLDACTLRDRLANGALSAIEVAEAYIAQIEARDPEVQAWAWFDPDFVRQQANHLDMFRRSGRAIGPLHGIPVGLKDVIDTARIPTENGAAIDAGRVPEEDAYVTSRLKQAGAIIMGKTVTTELAFLRPSKTRNPHDLDHTPGGSSAGAAAAVADAMVPLALGTQTGGSVIRPASYCGITGFKPTFGAIPRRGVLTQSPSLDTVGVFARSPADAALLADCLFGDDPADKATSPAPFPRLHEAVISGAPLPPTFALFHPPGWQDADPQLHEAFAELVEALGEQVFEVTLPPAFDDAAALRERVNFAEMAHSFHRYERGGRDLLGDETKSALKTGNAVLARDYLAALDWQDILYAGLDEVLQRSNAILCPAATGPAPEGLETTGNPIFNGLWTFCGTPAVTIPVLVSESGLPMGVQLVGARGDDARLLRTAQWMFDWIAQ